MWPNFSGNPYVQESIGWCRWRTF